jgi:hypothetical protein
MSSIIIKAFFKINLEFFAIVSFQIIFYIKFLTIFLSLYYELMGCITHNILDINLIYIFYSYIKGD